MTREEWNVEFAKRASNVSYEIGLLEDSAKSGADSLKLLKKLNALEWEFNQLKDWMESSLDD